ncbi:unnamed protein product [Sphagnum jensenii]|uniref:Uncharacterized protein n=2 Tax=Sphagnum jensenii TaxID=128206 RepID=A0ABP1AXV9_9BRYO
MLKSPLNLPKRLFIFVRFSISFRSWKICCVQSMCSVVVHGWEGRDGSCNEADEKMASKNAPPSKLETLKPVVELPSSHVDVLVFRVYEYAFGRLQICGQRSVDLANNVWLVKEVFPLVRRTPMLHNPFVQELGPVMHQDSTADQNGKIGDIKAALEGPGFSSRKSLHQKERVKKHPTHCQWKGFPRAYQMCEV